MLFDEEFLKDELSRRLIEEKRAPSKQKVMIQIMKSLSV